MKLYAKTNGQTISRNFDANKVEGAKARGWAVEPPKAEQPKPTPKKKKASE